MPSQAATFGSEPRAYITGQRLWLALAVVICAASGVALNLVNPTLILGVVGAGLLLVLLFHAPYLGILSYLVFEYTRLSAMFPALQALQVGKLIVLPTLVVWLVHHVVVLRTRILRDRVYLLFLIWLGLGVLSAGTALDQRAAYWAVFDLAKWFVTSLLIINLVDSLKKWQIFMWVLLLLNFKLSQFQLRAFTAGFADAYDPDHFIHQGVGAGSGFFGNATDFGVAIVVVFPFALYLIFSTRSKLLKLVALGFTGAFILSILRSGSRGAAMALFAMAALAWFKSKRKLASAVMLAAFLVGFWVVAPPAWRERLLSAQDYEQDATAARRITLWKAGFSMLRDHPFGVGINNFAVNLVTKYRPPGVEGGATAPHSIFVQAGSELGIGGLAVLLAVIVLIFRRNQATRKLYRQAHLDEPWILNFAHALDLSLLGFIVGGAFLTVLYYPHLYIILPLAVSLYHITRKKATTPPVPLAAPAQ